MKGLLTRKYLPVIGKGGFRTIYNFNNLHAIKNVTFTKETKDWALIKTIEEYFLYQISLALQIGPKVTQLFWNEPIESLSTG